MNRSILAYAIVWAILFLWGERAAAQETPVDSERACEVLASGVLEGAFDVPVEAWSFRPASRFVPQALCTAESQSAEGASSFEVALTIMKNDFDSPEAAVASLESIVETLIEDGAFVDDVGDRAVWAPKLSELSVAYRGIRFAVRVVGMDRPEENRAKSIELARRVGEELR